MVIKCNFDSYDIFSWLNCSCGWTVAAGWTISAGSTVSAGSTDSTDSTGSTGCFCCLCCFCSLSFLLLSCFSALCACYICWTPAEDGKSLIKIAPFVSDTLFSELALKDFSAFLQEVKGAWMLESDRNRFFGEILKIAQRAENNSN